MIFEDLAHTAKKKKKVQTSVMIRDHHAIRGFLNLTGETDHTHVTVKSKE